MEGKCFIKVYKKKTQLAGKGIMRNLRNEDRSELKINNPNIKEK